MNSQLNLVLERVVVVVNYIRTGSLKTRLNPAMALQLTWLSLTNVLSYAFNLHQEIHIFLLEAGKFQVLTIASVFVRYI